MLCFLPVSQRVAKIEYHDEEWRESAICTANSFTKIIQTPLISCYVSGQHANQVVGTAPHQSSTGRFTGNQQKIIL